MGWNENSNERDVSNIGVNRFFVVFGSDRVMSDSETREHHGTLKAFTIFGRFDDLRLDVEGLKRTNPMRRDHFFEGLTSFVVFGRPASHGKFYG